MPHQRIPKNTKTKKNHGALRLPTTYANRKNDNEIFAAWHSYVGRWISRDEFGQEIISVAFTPRLPRPGKDKPHGTLAGFIADGEYEGVLFFKSLADKTRRGKPVLLNGNLHRADRNLTRLQATLRLVPPHHTRGKKPRKKRLVLQLKKKRKTKKYVLEWVGAVSDTALSSVCIIGHRGLGFAGLDNRPKALSRAWYFGASGIEFDITVPYQYSWTTNGEQSRIPLLNRLMVYHPPLLNQTCDIDSIPAEFSPLKDIFEELQMYSVPFVYVDPKLTWLSTNNVKQVLKNITRFAHLLLRRGSSVIVSIAASDDRSGKFLSRSEAFQSSPYFATSQLSWTLEWTEVDKAREILARAKKQPTALSFNLTKIDGSLKWPLIEWLFKDVSKRDEKAIQKKSQILVFWTANDDDHFRGSLGVAKDRERMGRSGEPGEIGIMTDAPHRLAYWLATQRKHK